MSRQTENIRDELVFLGGLNTDDDPRFLPQGDYLDAVNVSVVEDGSGGVMVNVKGNESVYNISNSDYMRVCGWAYYDKHESIVMFVDYRLTATPSTARNRIVEYNPQTDTPTVIVEDTILGLLDPASNDYFVSCKISGDWLGWADNVNPDRLINMDDVGAVTDLTTYIDLHKIPPIGPPELSMGLDDTIVYNNIIDSYQFKYRYVYDDFRVSVYGQGSDIILGDVKSRVDEDYTLIGQQNYINIGFNSGNANVSNIDIAVRKGNNGAWFRFIKIKKDKPENIYTTGGSLITTPLVDATDYVYRFYNNEGRSAIGLDGEKQYDTIPDKSESFSFIGDGRIALGGNTEGKDLIDIDVALIPQISNPGLFDDMPITSVGISGTRVEINFDLDTTFLVRGRTLTGDYVLFDYIVDVTTGAGADTATVDGIYVPFSETLDSLDDIGSYLSSKINLTGLLGTGIGSYYTPATNILTITHPYGSVVSVQSSPYTKDDSIIFNRGYEYFTLYGYVNDLAFKRGYSHKLALVYEDKYGIKFPALVSKDTGVFINTIASGGAGFTHIQYTINNVAPSDAVAYRWAYAYTPKSFTQTIITDTSYFEDLDGNTNTELIALDISGNNQFVVPNYTVQTGDYIKIIEQGGSTSGVSGIAVDDAPEFIVDDIKDIITASGVEYNGTWLIIKPSNASGYSYGNLASGVNLYMNAIIEIYRQPSSTVDQVYYEIGGGGTCVGGTTNHDDWHTGNATGYLNQGDIWVRPLTRYMRAGAGKTAISKVVLYLEDPYPYINAPNKDVGITDPSIEIPESKNKYENTIKWSNKFFQDTKINGFSTFDYDSRQDVSESYGKIKGLEQLGKSLVVLCEEKILTGGVGYTEYLDASGNVNQIKSDSVIGLLRASAEDYGTFMKESIVNTGKYIYFFDLYNKAVVRKASNGLYPISGKSITPTGPANYKMRTYFKQLSDRLISSLTANNPEDVKVYMGYDKYYHNVYFTSYDANTPSNRVTLIFNEDLSRWTSRLYNSSTRFYPSTKTELMSIGGDDLYLMNSVAVDRCNLYGSQENWSLKFVTTKLFNSMKLYNVIGIYSDSMWDLSADDAIITLDNDSYNIMSSKIPSGRWRLEEGIYRSEFLRNAKSTSSSIKLVDLYNGEELRGYVLIVEMTNNSTDLSRLFKVEIDSELSG